LNTENSNNSDEEDVHQDSENHDNHEIHNYIKIPSNLECLMNSAIFILIIFIGNQFQKMKIVKIYF